MGLIFANNSSASVTSGGTTTSDTSWTVGSVAGFPTTLAAGQYFHIADSALPSEKIKVTGITGGGPTYTWTVVRGDEGSTAASHSSPFNVQQVVSSGDFGTFTQTFNVKSYGAKGDDSTDDTTAIQNAINACITAGGGIVYFPAGTYKVTSTLTATSSGNLNVYLYGDGPLVTIIDCHNGSATDCVRYYSSATGGDDGGGIANLAIYGANAVAGCTGLHAGDVNDFHLDNVYVSNFSGTGGIGIHFDNQYAWMELLKGRVYVWSNTTGVVFDVSGSGTTSTGSYARLMLDIIFSDSYYNGDGVVLQNGATPYDGHLGIYGNFNKYTSALTNAVLRVTGTTPAGHAITGNSTYSQMLNMEIVVGVECNNGSGTNYPSTMLFGSTGNNVLTNCYGSLNYNGFTATPSGSYNSVWPFTGTVTGDSVLERCVGTPQNNTFNTAGGLAVGNWTSAATLSNGSTITTLNNSLARVTNSGAVTGIILQQGNEDGNVVTVVNQGTGAVTFAAVGTSHVVGGVSNVIAPGGSQQFAYDGLVNSEWYAVNLAVGPFNVMTYGATGNGSTDDTTAIQAAITACINAGGGTVYFPAGTYKISSTLNIHPTVITNNMCQSVVLRGDGAQSTVIMSYVTGAATSWYVANNGNPSYSSGTGLRDICIDGTNAGNSSYGIVVGDMEGLHFERFMVRYFTGTSSIGLWHYNQYSWTEEAHFQGWIEKCTTAVHFSSNATNGGTNSFGYCDFDYTLYQGYTGNYDGVSLDGTVGAQPYHGSMRLRGNFNSSSSALTSAVVRLSNGATIEGMRFEWMLECNTGSGTTSKPTTIIMDSTSVVQGCYGILDFSYGGSSSAFTPASIATAGSFQFSGPISADSNLAAAGGYDKWTNAFISNPFGYGNAGTGGTVTQSTSKSTSVTLSKACGQVTMNSAALASATIVSFTLTNTLIAATDVLILNHVSGGTPGSYTLNAQCGSGAATINVRNNTGGSLSEAIVISFVLIKASTS
jgi:hypothetical protein